MRIRERMRRPRPALVRETIALKVATLLGPAVEVSDEAARTFFGCSGPIICRPGEIEFTPAAHGLVVVESCRFAGDGYRCSCAAIRTKF